MGEQEAPERDAGPEAGGDVAGREGRGVPVGEQEGDDPAGDGDFGALVGEDEEGAEEGCFVVEGGFEEGAFGGGGRWGGGCGCGWWGLRAGDGVVPRVEERGLGVGEVGFVGSEGPGCEEEVEDGDRDREEVVGRPAVAVGDERRGDQRADRSAQAVAAVEGAERAGGVGQVGAEDVVERQIQRQAQTGEEEGDDDDGEGRRAHERDVRDYHQRFGQHERFGAAESSDEQVGEGGGADEAEGVGHEDEGDNGVADSVEAFDVRN